MFYRFGLLGVVTTFILAMGGGIASGQKPRTVDICADFSLFPDNHKFPGKFMLAAFQFEKLGGTVALMVNQSGKDKGLQFPKEGAKVALPCPVPSVKLIVGTFGTAVTIEALDSKGKVVHSQKVPKTNMFQPVTVQVTAGAIASLQFMGGGSEGNLAKICVTLECR